MTPGEAVDVAIVGAGPAGATLATHLARRGVQVLVLERSPAWHWRAGGVFASPAAVAELRRAGLAETTIDAVTQPIPAMRLETAAGTTVRLTYGADTGGPMAVGFDRSALDPALERLAVDAGATVQRGVTVHAVRLQDRIGGTPENVIDLGDRQVAARVVVGADGTHSVVARAAGVARPSALPPRVGLTLARHDPRPDDRSTADARMIVGRDGYVGLARVPGEPAQRRRSCSVRRGSPGSPRTVPRRRSRTAARHGPPPRRRSRSTGAAATGVRHDRWRVAARDAGARRAGPGWLLVGDACGFLDPFTGEGLHRALVSAELAARPSSPDFERPRARERARRATIAR